MDEYTDAIAFTAREPDVGVVVVDVVGELDMATVPVVEEFVRDQLGDAVRTLVLDLSGVTFLGSTGINMLIALRADCRAAGTALCLVATTNVVLRPLQLTDLTNHFTIVTGVGEAG